MATNGNDSAQPYRNRWDAGSESMDSVETGLTKRELFAAMALQGMQMDNPSMGLRAELLAGYAVEMADALIDALNAEVK